MVEIILIGGQSLSFIWRGADRLARAIMLLDWQARDFGRTFRAVGIRWTETTEDQW